MTVRTRAAGHALCHSFDDDVEGAFVEKPAWCGKKIIGPQYVHSGGNMTHLLTTLAPPAT